MYRDSFDVPHFFSFFEYEEAYRFFTQASSLFKDCRLFTAERLSDYCFTERHE